MFVQIRMAEIRPAHGDRLRESANRDAHLVDRAGVAQPEGAPDLTRPGGSARVRALGRWQIPGHSRREHVSEVRDSSIIHIIVT